MRPYRLQPSELELEEPPQRHRRARAVVIVVASVAVHAAVLAAAFVSRAPDRMAPRSEVVRVLTGHVDPMTGAFEANGVADARIAKK